MLWLLLSCATENPAAPPGGHTTTMLPRDAGSAAGAPSAEGAPAGEPGGQPAEGTPDAVPDPDPDGPGPDGDPNAPQHVEHEHVEMPEGTPPPEGAPQGLDGGGSGPQPDGAQPTDAPPLGDLSQGDADAPPNQPDQPEQPTAEQPAAEQPDGEAPANEGLRDGVPVFEHALSEGTLIRGTIAGSQLAQVRFIAETPNGRRVMHLEPAVAGQFQAYAPPNAGDVWISAAELPEAGFLGDVKTWGALADPVEVGTVTVTVAFAMGNAPGWAASEDPPADRVLDPVDLPPPPE